MFKGLHLKMSGQKKEGNKLLRAIDSSADLSELCHEMNRFGNILMNNGLENYARYGFKQMSMITIFVYKHFKKNVSLYDTKVDFK